MLENHFFLLQTLPSLTQTFGASSVILSTVFNVFMIAAALLLIFSLLQSNLFMNTGSTNYARTPSFFYHPNPRPTIFFPIHVHPTHEPKDIQYPVHHHPTNFVDRHIHGHPSNAPVFENSAETPIHHHPSNHHAFNMHAHPTNPTNFQHHPVQNDHRSSIHMHHN